MHTVANTRDSSLKARMPLYRRCAPYPALTTVGLFLQLLRWHVLAREWGGFHCQRVRDACLLLLRSFLDVFAHDGHPSGLHIHVALTRMWVCPWPGPMPQADGVNCVTVFMRAGGFDFAALAELSENSAARDLPRQWWTELRAASGHGTVKDVCGTLCTCAAHPKLLPLLSQLLSARAVSFESRCLAMAEGKLPRDGCAVVPRWLSVKELMQADGPESYLVQYVTNCSETFSKCCSDWCFSIATDKGVVNGLPLQDTIIALPGNQAWLATPVAAPAHSAARTRAESSCAHRSRLGMASGANTCLSECSDKICVRFLGKRT